jgi:hypothetical protein
MKSEKPEYFCLRPEVEKAYGYSHAVKIGNSIKVSGAVSMDDEGNPTAVGDFLKQMKNCYSDLEKVLKHYGCTLMMWSSKMYLPPICLHFWNMPVTGIPSIPGIFRLVPGWRSKAWPYQNF